MLIHSSHALTSLFNPNIWWTAKNRETNRASTPLAQLIAQAGRSRSGKRFPSLRWASFA